MIESKARHQLIADFFSIPLQDAPIVSMHIYFLMIKTSSFGP